MNTEANTADRMDAFQAAIAEWRDARTAVDTVPGDLDDASNVDVAAACRRKEKADARVQAILPTSISSVADGVRGVIEHMRYEGNDVTPQDFAILANCLAALEELSPSSGGLHKAAEGAFNTTSYLSGLGVVEGVSLAALIVAWERHASGALPDHTENREAVWGAIADQLVALLAKAPVASMEDALACIRHVEWRDAREDSIWPEEMDLLARARRFIELKSRH